MVRRVVRLAAAALAVAAVGVVVPSPAHASTCDSATGVSVVVDFHQLGGGLQTFCDSGGAGEYADQQFQDAGHSLTYVQQQPGFVCRVDGAPSSDPCVRTPPSNAYWSLWWSDGRSGTWSYSSAGVQSLKVPNGGYVALSWQQGSTRAKPGAPPRAHGSSSPTAHPTTSHPAPQPSSSPHPPSSSGGAPPSSSAPGPSSSATDPAKAAGRNAKHPRLDPSKAGKAQGKRSHGPDRTEAADSLGHVATRAADDASGSRSGGLPGWLAPVVIAALFVGAGAIALVRRKTSGGP